MALEAQDLTPNTGTEIRASREELLAGTHAEELVRILDARGVLVFRNLDLDEDEQKRFGATFGEVLEGKDGAVAVAKITLDKAMGAASEYMRGSFFWHLDGVINDKPDFGVVLSAKALPGEGSVTAFANTYAAYDELSDGEKARFAEIEVVHSLRVTRLYVNPEPTEELLDAWENMPSRTRPLVWTHESGRKSLLIGGTASHIVDMPYQEGNLLLRRLAARATRPENVYRHQWAVGDTLVWDNTGTLHRADPYGLDSGRLMHRTGIAGRELVN